MDLPIEYPQEALYHADDGQLELQSPACEFQVDSPITLDQDELCEFLAEDGFPY